MAGLQPNSDASNLLAIAGLQPNSDGLQPIIEMASNLQ